MNKIFIAKLTTTIIGGLYAFLGFIGTLVPLDEILSEKLSVWERVGISLGVMLGAWLICFTAVAFILAHRKRFMVISANSGHKLYLQYGDLYDEITKR